jgi:hypothetical protein
MTMAAQILRFPADPEFGQRMRAVLNAIAERADSTHATLDQRRQAKAEAAECLDNGGSVGAAIQRGYDFLPSVRMQGYRQPSRTPPDAA